MTRWPAMLVVAALCLTAQVALPAPATQPLGPDVVVLRELVADYEPVTFDHKMHAQMAEMWSGCQTCHHRSPTTAPAPAELRNGHAAKHQADAQYIPACKSCHSASAAEQTLSMPNLKGAYHRQCLNCHREWSHENACDACHRLRDPRVAVATTPAPSVDDIVGRMHPPIPAPTETRYSARFAPAVGRNVLFRHEQHVARYGLKCAQCHHRDNCGSCHSGPTASTTPAPRPLRPGRTWLASHQPCVSCHEKSRCRSCHYHDDATAPAVFSHATTGQLLDADHAKLTCGQCHVTLRSKKELSCGGSECHATRVMAYPGDRPGERAPARAAAVQIAAAEAPGAAASQPTTRAVIRRIRR